MIMTYMSDGKIYKEHAEPNFEKEYDIIVAGLGSSGSFAAISAAVEGAKVLGIERFDGVGGMCTLGQVAGYYYGFSGGMYEQIDDEVQKNKSKFEDVHLHPDLKQAQILKKMRENKVDTAFCSVIVGIFMENDRVFGVRMLKDGKLSDIKTKILIDATSDGFLVRLLGVKTYFGRENDGRTAPYTTRITYYDKNGTVCVSNNDSGFVNQYDPVELSQKIITGHAGGLFAIERGGRVIMPSNKIGVREGLRFEGEQTLDFEGVLNSDLCKNPLFYAYSDIDKHGHDTAVDTDLFQDWYVISNLSTCTVRIAVPIGAVIPKDIKGFASAGRCLSVDSYVSAAVRMNKDMFRLGECLGILCADAVRENTDIDKTDYGRFKEKAEKRGCFYGDEKKNLGFSFPGNLDNYLPVKWTEDEEEILNGLDGDKPAVSIWSCRLMGEKIRPALKRELERAEDGLYKTNLAIALAITGDKEAAPYLRDAVKRRNCFFYRDCRRSNQFPYVNAICMLGRLHDRESYRILCEIAFNEKEYENKIYHTLKPDYLYFNGENFNFVYFQYFTHSIMALVKIASEHTELKDDLKKRLEILFSDDAYIRRITPLETFTKEYGEVKAFASYVMTLV